MRINIRQLAKALAPWRVARLTRRGIVYRWRYPTYVSYSMCTWRGGRIGSAPDAATAVRWMNFHPGFDKSRGR